MFSKIRLFTKLFLRKFFILNSFCKECGINIKDFSVTDKLWTRISKEIKHGNSLCYNCFCKICNKIGINYGGSFELTPINRRKINDNRK